MTLGDFSFEQKTRKSVKKMAHSDSVSSLGSLPTFTPQDVLIITIEDTDSVRTSQFISPKS